MSYGLRAPDRVVMHKLMGRIRCRKKQTALAEMPTEATNFMSYGQRLRAEV